MIDEHNVREMLHRRANAVPTPVVDAPKAARRARRRLLVNGAVATLAAAAIALAGLAGVDKIRSAPVPADQPTPSVTPSMSPSTGRFDSPLNGLSIGYPAGWQTRAATETWLGHNALAFGAPDVDVISDPRFRDDLYLAVVSVPLFSTSPQDWVVNHDADFSSLGICQGGGGGGGAGHGFQGNPAWYWACDEPHDASGTVVFFATATHGYIIYLHVGDEQHLQATYNDHWFWGRDGVLKTVELPVDALDTVSPSGSP